MLHVHDPLEVYPVEARVFPDRHCVICGQPTDIPPECSDCAIAEETAAKRRVDR